MLKTLSEARQSTLRNIAGACSNSPDFIANLNEATERLLRRGDWTGTVQTIGVCVRRGCVVWPRYVGQVRRVNICNGKLSLRNQWWEFFDPMAKGMCGVSCGMESRGKAPAYDDIRGENRYVRAYASCQADVGKTVTLFGIDNNGQPLVTKNLDGSWSQGVVLTLALPYVSTSTFVRHIDRVLKDQTQREVRLYAYDSINNVLEDLAVYEASETNPEYQRSLLKLGCAKCDTSFYILALVKLQFIPAQFDTDLVLIENLQALKDMVQSLKFREAGNIQEAAAYETSAIRELNADLANQTPDDQIPVDLGELGNTGIGVQRCY